MQCPVQQVHMSTKPFMKFSNELRYHQNQIFHRCVFVQRSELIDGFFRAGFLSGKQVGNGSVALGYDESLHCEHSGSRQRPCSGFHRTSFHIAERSSLSILVGCRTDAMIAVPVDVALGSFRVDVLAVGKIETPVIVFWGYRCRGFRLVRCVVSVSDRHPSFPVFLCGHSCDQITGVIQFF